MVEPLFKEACVNMQLMAQDPDFIAGMTDVLVKESSMTEKQAEEFIEKVAAPLLPAGEALSLAGKGLGSLGGQALGALGRHWAPILGLGSAAALALGPEWRHGFMTPLRKMFMYTRPEDALAAGEAAGGLEGIKGMEDLIRSTGGDITQAWKRPLEITEGISRLQRGQASNARARMMNQRLNSMRTMDAMGGGMGMGGYGMGMGGYGMGGMSPYMSGMYGF